MIFETYIQKGRVRLVLVLLQLLCYSHVFAQKTVVEVSILKYGVYPFDGKNALPAIRKALAENKNVEELILTFPKGRYDFYQDSASKSIRGFGLINMKNVTIDGQGSSFIFHSKMSPVYIESSENITLKNFSIDWDRPYISQGVIAQVTNEHVDIAIDKSEYPYLVEDGKIWFTGEGWKLGVELYNLYDKDKKDIVYRTFDRPMGAGFFQSKAEEIGDGVVRFYTKASSKPEVGTYVSMLHARYLAPCIQLNKSKDIKLNNVDIFHSLSMGVVAARTENIRLNDVNVTANEKKGRVFSAIADAFHFSGCKGLIKITNCAHAGQADDFVNIHGEYAPVKERLNSNTIIAEKKGKLRDVKELFSTGDAIWLVDSLTSQRVGPYDIKEIEPILLDNKLSGYKLIFFKDIPEGINDTYYIENKTWNPSVEIRDCRILKKHRARGILVTTPEKVLIENNYFNTAGAAILIEGDLNFWFESGAVENVRIRNNIFENCVTSGKYWGEAVITISPSFKPSGTDVKAYHRGIRIENNTFKHFDQSILFARSVDDLQFINNKLIKTKDYTPFSPPSGFSFDGCRNVKITGNSIGGDFQGVMIELKQMNPTDLNLNNAGLKVAAADLSNK